jgi:glycine/D-amino acid oxidase-like deaminating enzyme
MKIIVIGAGILGASVAYHLARRGAAVTILEGKRPAAGASGTTFACLNAFSSKSDAYTDFRSAAILYQYKLAGALRAMEYVVPSGTLRWAATEDHSLAFLRKVDRLRSCGIAVEYLSKTMVETRLELSLALSRAPEPIVRVPIEGWLNGRELVLALLDRAEESGARVLTGVSADAVEPGQALVRVHTSTGPMDADQVVLAAGIDTNRLTEPLGAILPIEAHPGVLIMAAAPVLGLRHVVYAGDLHFRPASAVAIIAGRTDHQRRQPPSKEEAAKIGEAVMEELRSWLREPHHTIGPWDVDVGIRPIPSDGLPLIGPLPCAPGVYVMACHSGCTIGALLGKLCAEEILADAEQPQLASFRVARPTTPAPTLQQEAVGSGHYAA